MKTYTQKELNNMIDVLNKSVEARPQEAEPKKEKKVFNSQQISIKPLNKNKPIIYR